MAVMRRPFLSTMVSAAARAVNKSSDALSKITRTRLEAAK
jgi:hypothetical protein